MSQKRYNNCDIGDDIMLKDEIIELVNRNKYEAFSIKDVISLSSYDSLRKNLERMTKEGSIRRIIRGIYDIPKYNNIFNMYNVPSINGVANALARSFNWNIYPSGNAALNILGLSTQIPSKYIYISSGPYRKYECENIIIEFKHASQNETNSFSYNTNLIIQALKELGKDNVNDEVLSMISKKYSSIELNNIIEEAQNTTIWIYYKIKRMGELYNEKNSNNE